MLRFLLNLLWFVLGGFFMGLAWWLAGVIALISIVGIPWARSCFVIGRFSFWPFGHEAVSRRALTGQRYSFILRAYCLVPCLSAWTVTKKFRGRRGRRVAET